MKIIFATIFFNFLCIFFFGMIYIYLKNEFINNNNFDIKLIDIMMFSTTVQSGVGLTNLFPKSFNAKLVTIIQQLTMICSYVIILYIIAK
jgi:hypothetical protein